MGILRAIICVLLPPLAVLDKGCGMIIVVTVLTCFGWVPGIIAALYICLEDEKKRLQ
ncbi:YqaE/Pmp3 family membrane protein [Verrucomicrobia bacterium LW23]|nr:YqaE/Pmp3 family membrane protein [Verrucomicrobia bacterium LW23]